MDEQFPSNSRTAAKETPPEKHVEKVISGQAVIRKPSIGKRFMSFFAGNARNVSSSVMNDVIIPRIKDLVADAVSESVEGALFGDVRSRRRSSSGSTGGFGQVAYNRYSSSANVSGPRQDPRQQSRPKTLTTRSSSDVREFLLATRVEADEVLNRLYDLVQKYEVATVADLYNLVGEPSNFMDEKWGWSSLQGARSHRTRDGYRLDLPNPISID